MDDSTNAVAGRKSDSEPSALLVAGKILGDFRLERCLGQGGMGQVWLAEQTSLRRKVAVKSMRSDLAANVQASKRFQAEATAVAQLTHPNIVQVYSIGTQDGLHYMALEFVEGTSLRAYMEKTGPLDIALTLKILRQVAGALQHAAEHGIVHRDIKPENILITRKAEAKVTDFGLARIMDDEAPDNPHLTQSGVIMGTPLYMSPEQVYGRKSDCRTDIYSLGVTTYHMLSGQPPFRGESAIDLAFKHAQSAPPSLRELRSEVPEELEAIVLRMMAKQPEDRFQNGKELLRALAGIQAPSGNGQRRTHIDATSNKTQEVHIDAGAGQRRTSAQRVPSRRRKAPSKRLGWILAGLTFVLLPLLGVAAAFVGKSLKERQAASTSPPAKQEPTVTAVLPVEPSPQVQPLPPPVVVNPPKKRPLVPATPVPFTEAERREEARLKKELPLTFSRENLRDDVKHALHLCAFYLHHGHLDEAEVLFKQMSTDKHRSVMLTGQIGEGIVLGLTGKAKSSNELFHRVLTHKETLVFHSRTLFFHPSLKPYVKLALDRNDVNASLTKELKELREALDRPLPRPDKVEGATKTDKKKF